MRKWYFTVPAGAGISLIVELIQLTTGIGLFDVDDLLANSLETAIGFCFVVTILSLFREKGKRLKPALIYGFCGVVFLTLVVGVFPVYALQEYGNPPCAPCFTNHTNHVNWVLKCELPDVPGKIATYKTQKRSIQDCDDFAQAYSEMIDADFDEILYYDDAVYYRDPGKDGKYHSLHADYSGTGYEYR